MGERPAYIQLRYLAPSRIFADRVRVWALTTVIAGGWAGLSNEISRRPLSAAQVICIMVSGSSWHSNLSSFFDYFL